MSFQSSPRVACPLFHAWPFQSALRMALLLDHDQCSHLSTTHPPSHRSSVIGHRSDRPSELGHLSTSHPRHRSSVIRHRPSVIDNLRLGHLISFGSTSVISVIAAIAAVETNSLARLLCRLLHLQATHAARRVRYFMYPLLSTHGLSKAIMWITLFSAQPEVYLLVIAHQRSCRQARASAGTPRAPRSRRSTRPSARRRRRRVWRRP